jgi:hypothetical protein
MKRFFLSISLFIFIFIAATLLTFYIQRNSRPAVFCTSLDHGAAVRPRDYCLMNPFRDKQPEVLAENVLQELKNGNLNAIGPYLLGKTENEKNRLLSNEKAYKIKDWRIGGRQDSENAIFITYWVSRENYPDILESVHFGFAREAGEIRPTNFGAIY